MLHKKGNYLLFDRKGSYWADSERVNVFYCNRTELYLADGKNKTLNTKFKIRSVPKFQLLLQKYIKLTIRIAR